MDELVGRLIWKVTDPSLRTFWSDRNLPDLNSLVSTLSHDHRWVIHHPLRNAGWVCTFQKLPFVQRLTVMLVRNLDLSSLEGVPAFRPTPVRVNLGCLLVKVA